jgi:hypothetical protein
MSGHLRRAAAVVAVFVVSLLTVVPAPTASAHGASDYFTTWIQFTSVNFWIATDFPPDSPLPWRTRMREAGANWDLGATGRPYVNMPNSTQTWTSNACTAYQQGWPSGIHMGAGSIAATSLCASGALVLNAQIRFSPAYGWHVLDSFPPAGSTDYDFESVATHEFGHAMGGWLDPPVSLGHFTTGSPADCTRPDLYTMCADAWPGEASKRTPTSHDVHTMANGYINAPW